MARKPRFWFEAADPLDGKWSLTLHVEAGGKRTSWTIKHRTTNAELSQIFYDLGDLLEPYMADGQPAPLVAPEKPQQSPDVVEDTQMSEEGSAELRAAKAAMVEKTGKAWFSNMNEAEEELPLYEIGHGGE